MPGHSPIAHSPTQHPGRIRFPVGSVGFTQISLWTRERLAQGKPPFVVRSGPRYERRRICGTLISPIDLLLLDEPTFVVGDALPDVSDVRDRHVHDSRTSQNIIGDGR